MMYQLLPQTEEQQAAAAAAPTLSWLTQSLHQLHHLSQRSWSRRHLTEKIGEILQHSYQQALKSQSAEAWSQPHVLATLATIRIHITFAPVEDASVPDIDTPQKYENLVQCIRDLCALTQMLDDSQSGAMSRVKHTLLGHELDRHSPFLVLNMLGLDACARGLRALVDRLRTYVRFKKTHTIPLQEPQPSSAPNLARDQRHATLVEEAHFVWAHLDEIASLIDAYQRVLMLPCAASVRRSVSLIESTKVLKMEVDNMVKMQQEVLLSRTGSSSCENALSDGVVHPGDYLGGSSEGSQYQGKRASIASTGADQPSRRASTSSGTVLDSHMPLQQHESSGDAASLDNPCAGQALAKGFSGKHHGTNQQKSLLSFLSNLGYRETASESTASDQNVNLNPSSPRWDLAVPTPAQLDSSSSEHVARASQPSAGNTYIGYDGQSRHASTAHTEQSTASGANAAGNEAATPLPWLSSSFMASLTQVPDCSTYSTNEPDRCESSNALSGSVQTTSPCFSGAAASPGSFLDQLFSLSIPCGSNPGEATTLPPLLGWNTCVWTQNTGGGCGESSRLTSPRSSTFPSTSANVSATSSYRDRTTTSTSEGSTKR